MGAEQVTKEVTRLGRASQIIDAIDIGVTAFAVTFGLVMLFMFRLDMIFNARITAGMQNPYPLLYSIAFSTYNGKEIYRYIEKALAENKEEVDGLNIRKYLENLELNETCWKLVNSTGGVIFGNCTGYGKKAVLPFVNGSLEVYYG